MELSQQPTVEFLEEKATELYQKSKYNDPRKNPYLVEISGFDGTFLHFFQTKEEVVDYAFAILVSLDSISEEDIPEIFLAFTDYKNQKVNLESLIALLKSKSKGHRINTISTYEDWKQEPMKEYIQDYLVDDDPENKKDELNEKELFEFYKNEVFNEDEFIEHIQGE